MRPRRTTLTAAIILFAAAAALLSAAVPAGVRAQVPVRDTQTISAADSLFRAGVEIYEAGDWTAALRRFRRVMDDFPVNRTTTAAHLMATRAAYQAGMFDEAVSLATDFLEAYPSSGYGRAVRDVMNLSLEALRVEDRRPVSLGVILSLDEDQVTDSQEMFNGIRLAVDDHNRAHPADPVRIVFRNTGEGAERVTDAVTSLADEGVTAIVGTLFSDDARAAAEAAEREGVVFMAPLATDRRVSDDRPHVFQANPSIETRGRLMARFAIYGLRIDRLGVIAEETPQGLGTTLSDAFLQQASEMGAEINLVTLLPDDESWFELDSIIDADTLSYVDALYIPLVTDDPVPTAGAVLSSLDRLGRDVRILGNSTWHDLPMRAAAGKYTTTYSNDFYPDDTRPEVTDFRRRYVDLAGREAGRIAFTGYDVTAYLLSVMGFRDDLSLADRLRAEPMYSGLGIRIEFDGGQINQGLFYHRYRDGDLTLIR
jgi:ABC-type branched-subunit amino acid transport system substrate-binding protein